MECILFTIFKRSNFKFNYYYLKLPRDSSIIFNKLFNNSFNNVFITRELLRLYFWQCSWRGWRGPSLSTSQLQLSCVCVCLAYKHRRPGPPTGAWPCQPEPALNTLSLSSQKHGLCLSTQHTPPCPVLSMQCKQSPTTLSNWDIFIGKMFGLSSGTEQSALADIWQAIYNDISHTFPQPWMTPGDGHMGWGWWPRVQGPGEIV